MANLFSQSLAINVVFCIFSLSSFYSYKRFFHYKNFHKYKCTLQFGMENIFIPGTPSVGQTFEVLRLEYFPLSISLPYYLATVIDKTSPEKKLTSPHK